MRKLFACAALLVTAGALPTSALAWWNDDWTFRKEITLDASAAGADVASSVDDVPVLVRLSAGNFEFWSDAKPDGSDLRVVLGDDKTPLKFHIERWDAANQMALVWVRVPRLAGGAASDKLFLYYGNADATAASEAAASYDTPQALVLQFSEADGLPLDATAYGTKVATSTAERVAASLSGGGVRFAGGQSITIPATGPLRLVPASGLTLSAWIKVEAAQDATIVALEDAGRVLALGVRGTSLHARFAGGDAPVEIVQSGGGIAPGTWHHVALRAAGDRIALLLDGAEVAAAPATLVEIAGTLTVGAAADGSLPFAGELDELQVAAVARSNDWLKASVRGQGPDARLVVYGADAQKEGSGPGYGAVIAKNLTVDAWVVIAICALMLVYALVLMVLKALHLSRVEKQNAAFMKEYEQLGVEHGAGRAKTAGLAALDAKAPQYEASTLFRLYHAGVAELDKRLAGQAVGAARAQVVGAQSIEAIRASLDASITRITQKLQSQMVMLTIAISGGPFLGLLGTVVGVMITFAAIAAAGDVNVNAIAPGVAAALAATVAGLAVAIPALFGYNWLNTRIKAITADNRVFVDEFVARMAEQYS
jgi:biopolymer transport protein ExbB